MPKNISGPKLAALYGLIPNQLGFCGPRQEKLKDFIAGKLTTAQIIPVLKQFEAAYPYYRLIARKNRAKPLDRKVVEAYWLGNNYLDKIKIADLRQLILKQFSAPGLLPKKIAAQKAAAVPLDSKPHHSFHVMILGSITGRVDFSGNIKLQDICRVGWGNVVKISNIPLNQSSKQKQFPVSKITIKYRSLVNNKKFKFGPLIKKEVVWDKKMILKLKVGDWVAIHWGYAIQKLSTSDINNLKKYTQNTINSLNAKKA